ncbi:hypothetical protein VCHC56A2_0385, partial [Vibrio cholerae HC-56A2]
MVARRA